MKILCTGDLHIGRRPSRLPAHLDDSSLSCGATWSRIVARAVEERVDLVAVSGDLVDQGNRFYEAIGPLEAGLGRLAEAGITTVMVAGNHDHNVLPSLVDGMRPEHVRFLGRAGTWERFTYEKDGARLYVDGWSFPDSHVRINPLESYPYAPDGIPVLGLLHTDLDQPRSPYAPVALAELRSRAPTFWLLGHVHAPALRESPGMAPVLYPGSPQAMNPGETGAHGVWVLELGPGLPLTCRHLPLSTVRYDVVRVDVTGVTEEAELDRCVTDSVRAHLMAITEEAGPLRFLCCRLRVEGRTPLHRRLEDRLRSLCADLELPFGEITAVVEDVVVETRPPCNLAALAEGNDAPGALARLIGELDAGSATGIHAALVAEAGRMAGDVSRARPYLSLTEWSGLPLEISGELRRQALLLLDTLVADKELEA